MSDLSTHAGTGKVGGEGGVGTEIVSVMCLHGRSGALANVSLSHVAFDLPTCYCLTCCCLSSTVVPGTTYAELVGRHVHLCRCHLTLTAKGFEWDVVHTTVLYRLICLCTACSTIYTQPVYAANAARCKHSKCTFNTIIYYNYCNYLCMQEHTNTLTLRHYITTHVRTMELQHILAMRKADLCKFQVGTHPNGNM